MRNAFKFIGLGLALIGATASIAACSGSGEEQATAAEATTAEQTTTTEETTEVPFSLIEGEIAGAVEPHRIAREQRPVPGHRR